MEDLIREVDPSRPFFEFLTDMLDGWVAYYAEHPHERALHAAVTLEVEATAFATHPACQSAAGPISPGIGGRADTAPVLRTSTS